MARARIRWITFSHTEADERGALGPWVAAVPAVTTTHGQIGRTICLNDQALRPPRALTMLTDGPRETPDPRRRRDA